MVASPIVSWHHPTWPARPLSFDVLVMVDTQQLDNDGQPLQALETTSPLTSDKWWAAEGNVNLSSVMIDLADASMTSMSGCLLDGLLTPCDEDLIPWRHLDKCSLSRSSAH